MFTDRNALRLLKFAYARVIMGAYRAHGRSQPRKEMENKRGIHGWEVSVSKTRAPLNTLSIVGEAGAINEVVAFMRGEGPESDSALVAQANAWRAVCSALNEVAKGWILGEGSGQERAVATIKRLGKNAVQKPTEPIPFNLYAAKAGAPLVTRDGRRARFLAHVQDATNEGRRVVAFIEGSRGSTEHDVQGRYCNSETSKADLFMAPKPKRTVWVNMYTDNRKPGLFYIHETEEMARNKAAGTVDLFATAVPVEVDA